MSRLMVSGDRDNDEFYSQPYQENLHELCSEAVSFFLGWLNSPLTLCRGIDVLVGYRGRKIGTISQESYAYNPEALVAFKFSAQMKSF